MCVCKKRGRRGEAVRPNTRIPGATTTTTRGYCTVACGGEWRSAREGWLDGREVERVNGWWERGSRRKRERTICAIGDEEGRGECSRTREIAVDALFTTFRNVGDVVPGLLNSWKRARTSQSRAAVYRVCTAYTTKNRTIVHGSCRSVPTQIPDRDSIIRVRNPGVLYGKRKLCADKIKVRNRLRYGTSLK